MADGTHIEWTDATWNPVTGCSLASPGCTNCYAMKLAGTRLKHEPKRAGLTQPSKAGPVWTGEVRFNEDELAKPLRWKRPRMIFVCAHGDLFHESVPDAWIDRIVGTMAIASQHIFQVLTKRSARMRKYFGELLAMDPDERIARFDQIACDLTGSPCAVGIFEDLEENEGWPLPNVWLGVSVEDQQRADERIPDLLATPAAVRWISAEPLLGEIDLRPLATLYYADGLQVPNRGPFIHDGIDWVVVGGESGPGARPMHPDWARSLRDQCAAAGVPFFFKQWGEWWPNPQEATMTIQQFNRQLRYIDVDTGREKTDPTRTSDRSMRKIGKKRAGRLLDGVEHNGMPGDV